MRDEQRSVLENVARLERENAELAAQISSRRQRIDDERAAGALEDTIHARRRSKPSAVKFAAAISFGLAFGLVTLAVTLLLMPSSPRGGYHERDMRGGSAGVCR